MKKTKALKSTNIKNLLRKENGWRFKKKEGGMGKPVRKDHFQFEEVVKKKKMNEKLNEQN